MKEYKLVFQKHIPRAAAAMSNMGLGVGRY